MWSSSIHLDLILVQRDKIGSILILLHDNCQLCWHHLLKMLSFPLDRFYFLVKDQVTIGMWVHFWVFNSIPLIYMSVSVPVPCSFYQYCCGVELKVRDKSLLLVRIVFDILGFFVDRNEFANCFFYLFEELSWNFDGNCIESVHCFWQDCHFYNVDPSNWIFYS
jgi:hypothetical protein